MGRPHSPMIHDSYFIVIATTYLWMASEGTLLLMSLMTMAFYRVVLRGEGVENDPKEHNRLSFLCPTIECVQFVLQNPGS
jgi:hypothetical protein